MACLMQSTAGESPTCQRRCTHCPGVELAVRVAARPVNGAAVHIELQASPVTVCADASQSAQSACSPPLQPMFQAVPGWKAQLAQLAGLPAAG